MFEGFKGVWKNVFGRKIIFFYIDLFGFKLFWVFKGILDFFLEIFLYKGLEILLVYKILLGCFERKLIIFW